MATKSGWDSLWKRMAGLLVGIFLIGVVPSPVLAIGVGTVEVMDIDEVGDAARIARAKAKKRAEESEDDEGDSGGVSSSDGCSDLNIGNVKTSVGQPVPKNVTIVIEGPVIQQNKCR